MTFSRALSGQLSQQTILRSNRVQFRWSRIRFSLGVLLLRILICISGISIKQSWLGLKHLHNMSAIIQKNKSISKNMKHINNNLPALKLFLAKFFGSCASTPRHKLSSTQVVLNDDELLTLILLHVPWRKLMSLKRVSKQWHSVITTPHFIRLRNLLPPRTSGLFIRRQFCYHQVYFVPLDDSNNPTLYRNHPFAHDPKKFCILQSCNGLLLCSTGLSTPHERHYCYVYNPSTNQLATLPKPPFGTERRVFLVGFTFDASKSLHYKVLVLVCNSLSARVGDLHIYSSETRTWKASIKSFCIPLGPRLAFRGGVYWKGCMHWLSKLDSKPETISDCLYFNVDEERIGTFPRPPIFVKSTSRSLYFGASEDHLHFIESCPFITSLSVYEMKSDYSGWFFKYRIHLDRISKAFPEMYRKNVNNDRYYEVGVLSLVRKENFQEDSFVVLNIPGKVIRYNLVDRSFKVIWNYGVDLGISSPSWFCGNFGCWPYIESGLV